MDLLEENDKYHKGNLSAIYLEYTKQSKYASNEDTILKFKVSICDIENMLFVKNEIMKSVKTLNEQSNLTQSSTADYVEKEM